VLLGLKLYSIRGGGAGTACTAEGVRFHFSASSLVILAGMLGAGLGGGSELERGGGSERGGRAGSGGGWRGGSSGCVTFS